MDTPSSDRPVTVGFSLIVPTIRRQDQLDRLLASLDGQDYSDFEVIIVDQNPPAFLDDIISRYRDHLQINHIRTDIRGASRARNIGLKHVAGRFVAFPDDDCWYPPRLLRVVAQHLTENPNVDGLCGKTVDENGRDSANRWGKEKATVSRNNIWNTSIAAASFVRSNVVRAVGDFDEELGVGSGTKWGSGEETDYIVRAIDLGFRFLYDPTILVHHPQVISGYDEQARHRAHSYGLGFGYVLRKQRFPIRSKSYLVMRPLAGTIVALVTGRWSRARYYIAVFSGRISGLRG